MINQSRNGGVKNGNAIHGSSQYVTVYTVLDHEAGDFGAVASGTQNMEVFKNIVHQKAQMKSINVSSEVVDLSVAGNRAFYGLGTNFNQAATTVYTIKFMTEQPGFIKGAEVLEMLQGLVVPFETAGVPVTGGSTADIDAYETADAAAKNINLMVFDNL